MLYVNYIYKTEKKITTYMKKQGGKQLIETKLKENPDVAVNRSRLQNIYHKCIQEHNGKMHTMNEQIESEGLAG